MSYKTHREKVLDERNRRRKIVGRVRSKNKYNNKSLVVKECVLLLRHREGQNEKRAHHDQANVIAAKL